MRSGRYCCRPVFGEAPIIPETQSLPVADNNGAYVDRPAISAIHELFLNEQY
jgi:hypothetical protein